MGLASDEATNCRYVRDYGNTVYNGYGKRVVCCGLERLLSRNIWLEGGLGWGDGGGKRNRVFLPRWLSNETRVRSVS